MSALPAISPVKIFCVGDSTVGKSSLMTRFCENVFTSSFIGTVGIDFKIRTLGINGQTVKLQIWDTAGQERFRAIAVAHYRGAQGVLLVYDVTNEQSFQSARMWMQRIEENAPDSANVMLVGNKCDRAEHKVVDTARGQALADEFGIPFLETSAKEDINVDTAFVGLATSVQQRIEQELTGVVLENKKQGTGHGWCWLL